jgi:hypothetical protein
VKTAKTLFSKAAPDEMRKAMPYATAIGLQRGDKKLNENSNYGCRLIRDDYRGVYF